MHFGWVCELRDSFHRDSRFIRVVLLIFIKLALMPSIFSVFLLYGIFCQLKILYESEVVFKVKCGMQLFFQKLFFSLNIS